MTDHRKDEEMRRMAVPICSVARIIAVMLVMTLIPSCAMATSGHKEAPPARKERLSVQNILRWPLEGPAGADRVISALLSIGKFSQYQGPQYSGENELLLDDGFVIANSWIINGARQVDINLRDHPWLLPAEAQKISGATKEQFFFTSHGENIGETYSVEMRNMLVRFTTDTNYKCVRGINLGAVVDER